MQVLSQQEYYQPEHISSSEPFLAEMLLRSPRKLCSFIPKQYVYRIKVSEKHLI